MHSFVVFVWTNECGSSPPLEKNADAEEESHAEAAAPEEEEAEKQENKSNEVGRGRDFQIWAHGETYLEGFFFFFFNIAVHWMDHISITCDGYFFL